MANQRTAALTIPSGGVNSTGFKVAGGAVGLLIPPGFTGTTLTIQVGLEGDANYKTLRDASGAVVTMTVVADSFCAFYGEGLRGVVNARVVAGTPQAADAVLTLVYTP